MGHRRQLAEPVIVRPITMRRAVRGARTTLVVMVAALVRVGTSVLPIVRSAALAPVVAAGPGRDAAMIGASRQRLP